MPDHFAGTTERETIEKMWGALDGFIRTKDQRGPAVDAPDKYAFTPPDAVKDRLGDMNADPYFKMMREAAFAAKMTGPEFNSFMGAILSGADKMASAAPATAWEDNTQVLSGNRDWAKNMQAQGRFSADEVAELDAMMLTKAGSSLIAKMQQQLTPGYAVAPPSQAGGSYGQEPATAQDAARLASDPRYQTDSRTYDPGFRKWADGQMMRTRGKSAA